MSKKSITCLNASTTGTAIIDDPIIQVIYRYKGFRSIAIPKDMAPLSYTLIKK